MNLGAPGPRFWDLGWLLFHAVAVLGARKCSFTRVRELYAVFRAILIPMKHHIPWALILLELVKLLKFLGIIPGAVAAFGVRKLWQKWRQSQAISGWPATDATIQSGRVQKEGFRVWAEITYTYYVGEYRTGVYVRRLRRQEAAEDFIRQVRDRRVQVHYSPFNPDRSVILDRNLEMIALLAPQFR